MSDDSFLFSANNTSSSSESDDKQNDTTLHTDTMTESDTVSVLQANNNNNSKKPFDPNNYEIIYEEAMNNTEFKSLFFKTMHGEEVSEPIHFLAMTDDYSQLYKNMRELREFKSTFTITAATTTTTINTSSSSNSNSSNQPSSSASLNTTSSSNIVSNQTDNLSISAASSSVVTVIQNNNSGATTIVAPITNTNSSVTTTTNVMDDQEPTEIITIPITPQTPTNLHQTNNSSNRGFRRQFICIPTSSCTRSTAIPNNNTNFSGRVVQEVVKVKNTGSVIFDTFLKPTGKYQLNLGWNKVKILQHWEDICKRYEILIGRKEECDDMQGLAELIERLHPAHLFRDVLEKVHQDLKMDLFPRFVRSKPFRNLLKKKGEKYTRTIGIDISKGYKLDLRFKPQDLRKDLVTDSDIYFGYTLAEDTPDWELFYDDSKTHCQCYLSKETYSFDTKGMKGMKLAKTVMLLPFDLEDCWAMFWHGDFHKVYDPLSFSENTVVHYSPPSPTPNNIEPSSHLFGRTYGRTIIDLSIPLLKKRVYDYIYSTIWDSNLEGFMNIGKSVDPSIISSYLPEADNENVKNYVESPGLFYHIFIRTHDRKTRYFQMTYFDLGLPLNSDYIFKQIWKNRTKIYRDGFLNVLNKLTDKGKKKADHSNLVDNLYFKAPVDDFKKIQPFRSWHSEWMQLRKGSTVQTIAPPTNASEEVRIILVSDTEKTSTSETEQTSIPRQDDTQQPSTSSSTEIHITEDACETLTKDEPNPEQW